MLSRIERTFESAGEGGLFNEALTGLIRQGSLENAQSAYGRYVTSLAAKAVTHAPSDSKQAWNAMFDSAVTVPVMAGTTQAFSSAKDRFVSTMNAAIPIALLLTPVALVGVMAESRDRRNTASNSTTLVAAAYVASQIGTPTRG